MQIKKKMSEMKNADVRWLSLVTRAANRIPFRVVKSDKEQGMLDLTSLGRRVMKAEKPAPEIVGVVVFKHEKPETMEAVKAELVAHGFSVEDATENEDGTVLYKQGDIPEDEADTSIVRLSEDMAVVVKGFSTYTQALSESVDFNEIMPAQGFYNGVRTASEGLMMTISNIMQKCENGEMASTNVKDATKKFATYVSNLMTALPSAAFKADLGLGKLLLDTAMTDQTKTEAAPAVKTEAEKTEAVKTEATEKTAEQIAAETAATEAETAAALALKAEQDKDPMLAMKSTLEAMTQAMTAMGETIKNLVTKQETVDSAIAEIARKTDDANQKLGVTVLAAAKADQEQTQPVKKSDEDPRTGCFDSATFRRNRR